MQNDLLIHRLRLKMSQLEASDLHIKIGSPLILRVAATLHRVDLPILTAAETHLPRVYEHIADSVQDGLGERSP